MTGLPPRPGMASHFGITIISAEKDRLVGEIMADERHLNAIGILHGGAQMAFADDLGGSLAGLNLASGMRTTTIESKTNFFRAGRPGRIRGVSVPLHVGRRTIVLQTSIYDSDDRLLAIVTQTQLVLPRDPAPPV